jgi:mannitol/fructose-specific phosphotransferase system IIA component (Ntr-type)
MTTKPLGKQVSLAQMLPCERINLDVRVNSWQDAIRESGKLLLQTGAITPDYIDAMIHVTEELGPYIVIAKGIAMPHASPDSGAKETALSLVRLSTPVEFGNPDNDPVSLVFGLAAVDHNRHIQALQVLAELIMNKEKMALLFSLEDAKSVCEVISQFEVNHHG